MKLPDHVGSSVSFMVQDHQFIVKKINRAEFCLFDGKRTRFGNRRQIRADIDHCILTGKLPAFQSGSVY